MTTNKLKLKQTDPDIQAYIDAVGDGIIESYTSPTSGCYVKFRDGTLFCYNDSISFTMQVGSVSYIFPFPFAFYSAPAISVLVGNPSYHWNYYCSDQQVANNPINIYTVVTNLSTEQPAHMKYMAIGRWKA